MNKAAKEGITAQWWSFRDMPPDIAGQIRQISGSWVADKGLPEMGFMLGGLAELYDPDVRCLVAVGRRPHGPRHHELDAGLRRRPPGRLDDRLHAQEPRPQHLSAASWSS